MCVAYMAHVRRMDISTCISNDTPHWSQSQPELTLTLTLTLTPILTLAITLFLVLAPTLVLAPGLALALGCEAGLHHGTLAAGLC